jgi:myosin heavy subunit
MQLKTLMDLLSQTEPHYIRCIKPNMFKIQRCFDAALVYHQLSYAGMMETIKIRYWLQLAAGGRSAGLMRRRAG